MYNLGDLSIPPYHNELELNLIATTREGADASKEFYAHISKKEIRIFRKGKVPLSFAVYRYIAKLAMMYNRVFYCAILLMCFFYCFFGTSSHVAFLLLL